MVSCELVNRTSDDGRRRWRGPRVSSASDGRTGSGRGRPSSTRRPASRRSRAWTVSRSAAWPRDTGMSKSGLFAHFGSKEELQLATIAAAEDVFQVEVLGPALAEPGGAAPAARPLRPLPRARGGGRVPGRMLLRVRRSRARHPPGPAAGPHRRGLRRLDHADRGIGAPGPGAGDSSMRRSTRTRSCSRSTPCSPRRTASSCCAATAAPSTWRAAPSRRVCVSRARCSPGVCAM